MEVKRISGYMFGEGSLYFNMSVFDNLFYFVKFYRMFKFEVEKCVREFLEFVGFKDVVDKKVGSFLIGMK